MLRGAARVLPISGMPTDQRHCNIRLPQGKVLSGSLLSTPDVHHGMPAAAVHDVAVHIHFRCSMRPVHRDVPRWLLPDLALQRDQQSQMCLVSCRLVVRRPVHDQALQSGGLLLGGHVQTSIMPCWLSMCEYYFQKTVHARLLLPRRHRDPDPMPATRGQMRSRSRMPNVHLSCRLQRARALPVERVHMSECNNGPSALQQIRHARLRMARRLRVRISVRCKWILPQYFHANMHPLLRVPDLLPGHIRQKLLCIQRFLVRAVSCTLW